jgi:FkbM family methyltransferase
MSGIQGVSVLPGGEVCEYIDQQECESMYEEIFGRQVYMQHGIRLRDSDIVFDVGCNIGLFALFCATKCKDISVIGFEPVPPIAAVANRNFHSFGEAFPDCEFQLFPCGVTSLQTQARGQFFYFPNFPAESTRFIQEREDQRATLLESIQTSVDPDVAEFGAKLAKFNTEPSRPYVGFDCQITTLSQVIETMKLHDNGLRINLLKIDVEGDELNVLEGIGSESNWSLIDQIVVEVHDVDNRLAHVLEIIRNHNFSGVQSVQQTIEVVYRCFDDILE